MASYRVFRKKLFFFPRMLSILRLPRWHWAVIGCTKYGQPIGVTDSTLSLLRKSLAAICRRGMGFSRLGKNTIFTEHPVVK